MNREFAKRQAQVLEVLEILVREASARKETLVFLGGSAIQTAVLKEPKRLSVDLDIHYSGDTAKLLGALGGDYKVDKRQSKGADMFDHYSIVHGDVQVKVDIAKFKLAEHGKPWGSRAVGEAKFRANVASPDYLLASKLATLAIGTVGRRQFSPMDFLKDVFDANFLLDEFGATLGTLDCFGQICEIQNRINKTSFAEAQIIESAVKALLESANTDDSKATIKSADLGNFNQYSLGGIIKKTDYWAMAYRLAAYAHAITFKGRAVEAVKEIEKNANEKYADKDFVAMCEQKLAAKGIGAKQLHELKILAPKALVYFYYAHYPPGAI
jgi:hypothetical protein